MHRECVSVRPEERARYLWDTAVLLDPGALGLDEGSLSDWRW